MPKHEWIYYCSLPAPVYSIGYHFYSAGHAYLIQWTFTVSLLLDRCSREPSRTPAWQLPCPLTFAFTFGRDRRRTTQATQNQGAPCLQQETGQQIGGPAGGVRRALS